MKVWISDAELARCIAIGLAVTGKRGQSNNAEVNILRQLGRYDIFRNADAAETMSMAVPLFKDNYGVERARVVFEMRVTQRIATRSDFDRPLKIDQEC